ncbi:hypothetical protein MLD38_026734 [Melastoma candidum]|uniref:Uncharacterized protein n=1 Tax=Melastoma candidum TaxID=119954 RepID=A0ACB9P0F6_9MYRT|nr:hypothetical protein MLD38_026734 [Melastoma candidum]
MLVLGNLQPLQLLKVWDVHAIPQGAPEPERVEELPSRVSLVTNCVREFLRRPGPRVAHSTDCELGLKKSSHRLLSTHHMSNRWVPSRDPKEKVAIAPGSAPALNHGMPLHARPTKIPTTAAIAHRPWISSASLYHLRKAGSFPSPRGSNP